MKTTAAHNNPNWANALTDRQRSLLHAHNIVTEQDYLDKRDSLPEAERNQIDDIRFTERMKAGQFFNMKEFMAYVPARFDKTVKEQTSIKQVADNLKNAVFAHIELLKLSNSIVSEIKSSVTSGSLLKSVKSFAHDLFARESVIWRARMGLLGKRMTLDEVGRELGGLTRERIRQIEAKMLAEFLRGNTIVDELHAALIKLDNDNPVYLETLKEEIPSVLSNIELDLAVLEGVLESLNPKHYIIEENGCVIISTQSKTAFDNEVKIIMRNIEKIFRKSELPLSLAEIVDKLVADNTHPVFARFAVERTKQHGYMRNNLLLSPDNNYSNVVIGILQQSDEMIHLNQLALMVADVVGVEYINPASLRGTLGLAPIVKNFGRGVMGLPKHQKIDYSLILTLAKMPLAEAELLHFVNKDGVVVNRYNLIANRDVIEIAPGVWGLTTRDNPYTIDEINKLAAIFDGKSGITTEEMSGLLAINDMPDYGLSFRDLCKIIYSVLNGDTVEC